MDYCSMANRSFAQAGQGINPTCLWRGHNTCVLVGYFHVYQRNPSWPTGIAGDEDEVWDLGRWLGF